MNYWAVQRRERLQAGLCIGCGTRPPESSTQMCDECRERRRLVNKRSKYRRYYGLELETIEAMLTRQNNSCAICGKFLSIDLDADRGDKAVVDHDHASGAVRSLLCTLCNVGLGAFQDSPELLQKAKGYLELHTHHQRTGSEGRITDASSIEDDCI